jgi:uncharacterized membrane protein (DUF2068 family)
MASKGGKDGLIRIIGVFKLVKALMLFAVAVGALTIFDQHTREQLTRLIEHFNPDPKNRVIGYLSEHVFNVSPKKLIVVTLATCLYGVLFVIEGIGLLMCKRWAEYLTVTITLSFIPLEIYELTRKVSPLKIGTLVLNLAIAVYLIVRLKQKKPAARTGKSKR